MVVEIGVEEVLGLHQLGQVSAGKLAAECGVHLAAGKSAGQLLVHVPRALQTFIVAHKPLNVLAFHGLPVDGGMTGILDCGIQGDHVFERGHIGFGGGGTVGMRFRALTVLMIDADSVVQALAGKIPRTGKAVEIPRLVKAVFGSVIAPVVITGLLHPCRIALRRTIVDDLPCTEEYPLLGKLGLAHGGIVGVRHFIRKMNNGAVPILIIHLDLHGGDVRARFDGVGTVSIYIRGKIRVDIVGPAQSGAVHPSGRIHSIGPVITHRMIEQTDVQIALEQALLKDRHIRNDHCGAAVPGGHACGGVDLIRAQDG